MAITTLQGLADGILPGRPIGKFSTVTVSGLPPACDFVIASGFPAGSQFSAYSTAANGAVITKDTIGALPFVNPTTGNTYLAGMKWPHGASLIVTLVDFLWSKQVPDKAVITPQAINSVPFPNRDINGTANGDGVFIALTTGTSGVTGTGAVQISYTNQNGTPGRTGNWIWSTTNPLATYFYPFSLEDGDTGVRSVQTLTLTASFSAATMGLVAFRPIATITPLLTKTNEPVGDAFSLGMPQIYNDSCLTFIYHFGGNVSGIIEYTQG